MIMAASLPEGTTDADNSHQLNSPPLSPLSPSHDPFSSSGTPPVLDPPTTQELRILEQLHAIGFTDDTIVLPLVRKHKGDINAVVNQLLR